MKNPVFVIHKHKAKNLHYDFRLEIGGVLKSWVLPKGPSLNPKDKRLAIEVEDHPLTYIHFEGEIAQGNYGAGEVIIWDRGKYTFGKTPIIEQYETGRIKIELKGKKLKGSFELIKLKKWSEKTPKWLLIKKYDEYISYDEIINKMPFSVVSIRSIKNV